MASRKRKSGLPKKQSRQTLAEKRTGNGVVVQVYPDLSGDPRYKTRPTGGAPKMRRQPVAGTSQRAQKHKSV